MFKHCSTIARRLLLMEHTSPEKQSTQSCLLKELSITNKIWCKYSCQWSFAVLSLFTIVTFKNDLCTSTSGNNGTCYSSSDCSKLGGVASGTCASGFGVCCLCKFTKILVIQGSNDRAGDSSPRNQCRISINHKALEISKSFFLLIKIEGKKEDLSLY